LERWSLIDRLPTPEVQEKQVAKEEVVLDGSLMKKNDANMEVTSLTDNKVKRDVRSISNDNAPATQSTKEVVKVESNMASTKISSG